MTLNTEITARLQSLRANVNSHSEGSFDAPMRSSSPATDAADAAVRKHEANVTGNIKEEEMSDIHNDSGDTTRCAPVAPKIAHPQPTLTLPPNYPFRTTETGYPIFRVSRLRRENQPRRATMVTEQGFMDPRVTAFVNYWTKMYIEMGNDPLGPAEGMFQLRLACKVRGLATYGARDGLVVRLVERALRDAARGWSEIADSVGVIKYEEAPGLPDAVAVLEEKEDTPWYERMWG